MTHQAAPTVLSLYRPAWLRWLDGLAARRRALRRRAGPGNDEPGPLALDELSDATLRDIGAPQWLRSQASRRREIDSIALQAARAGLASGARW